MTRYFMELAYKGTNFSGWQVQPNQITVQQAIETALFTVLRQEIALVGCGRTDAGVHASQYYVHFDTELSELPPHLLLALNGLLRKDIVIYRIFSVAPEVHARFGAVRRSYVYHMSYRLDPFRQDLSWHNAKARTYDPTVLQAAAEALLSYNLFEPLCKTNSGVHTMNCNLMKVEWRHFPDEFRYEFHISANRFLRGMVRMVVGMCCGVAAGHFSVEDIHHSLQTQTPLPRPWSVPADGLFLSEVAYRKEHMVNN